MLNPDASATYLTLITPDVTIEKAQELLSQATADLSQKTGAPVARIIGYTALENLSRGDNHVLLSAIADAIAQNRLMGNLTLAIARSDLKITPLVLDIVDWHLKLIERNGYSFMRVVKPISTPYLSVTTDVTEARSQT